MLTKGDREEALRRFVPYDSVGPLPTDQELAEKLATARAIDAADAELDAKLAQDEAAVSDGGELLKRLADIESRLAAIEKAGSRL